MKRKGIYSKKIIKMKNHLKIEDYSTILEQYEGGNVALCDFSLSLHRIALEVVHEKREETLYILFVSCDFYSGPLVWRNSHLSLEHCLEDNSKITIIRDLKNGYFVKSGGVVMMLYDEEEDNFKFDEIADIPPPIENRPG